MVVITKRPLYDANRTRFKVVTYHTPVSFKKCCSPLLYICKHFLVTSFTTKLKLVRLGGGRGGRSLRSRANFAVIVCPSSVPRGHQGGMNDKRYRSIFSADKQTSTPHTEKLYYARRYISVVLSPTKFDRIEGIFRSIPGLFYIHQYPLTSPTVGFTGYFR